MSALIGALRVSLSADTAQFEAGMKRAQRSSATAATGIQKSMSIIKAGVSGLVAGLSVGMFVNAIKGALDYAGSLGEVAQQLGVTTRDLQVFRFAAGQVGVSQEQLETGLSKLTITLGKVAAGAKQPIAALNAIGISVDQLKGKDTGEAFRIIADGLQKVTDRSQRAAVEVALFGKSGAMLDNLLSGGAESINGLALAAEKLGIVLSDEQIQRADDTADKLEALKTVLAARIAGVVADNADSILGLADALGYLVQKLGDALGYLTAFRAVLADFERNYSIAAIVNGTAQVPQVATQLGQAGRSIKLALPPVKPKITPGADIGKFLAGGGGSKKHKGAGRADHSAEDALRDSYQFDQELRRAQMDVLRATQDLAHDYVERTNISIQILDAEKASRDAEHQYQIALYKLTSGKQGQSEEQVRQIKLEEDRTDALERQKLLEDEQLKRQEDFAHLEDNALANQMDVLQSQARLAETASERRDVELRILDLAYKEEKMRLERIMRESKDWAEVEAARQDLSNLDRTYGSDRQGVINSTRGPLEEWAASVPKTAAQINEAIQSIEVEGLEGLSDGIADVITGAKSLGDAFSDVAKSIIADLVRMSVRMLMFRALSSVFGGLFGGSPSGGADPWSESMGGIFGGVPKFAGGGSFSVLGRRGVDRNMLSLNGLPMAHVSYGERISVGDGQGSPSVVVNQYNTYAGNAVTREDLARVHQVTVAAAKQAVSEQNRRR